MNEYDFYFCCDLLSKSEEPFFEHNSIDTTLWGWAVVICFQNQKNRSLNTTLDGITFSRWSCDLLSKSEEPFFEHNLADKRELTGVVVICFQNQKNRSLNTTCHAHDERQE